MVLRFIIGDDSILLGEAITRAVDELVGNGDRGLMLETLTEVDYRADDGTWQCAPLLDAVRTPPFLTDRRVVVGRHLSRFGRKDQYAPLVSLLAEPLATTDLVLIWERGVDPKVDRLPVLPKPLQQAADTAGITVENLVPPKKGDGGQWLRAQLNNSTLQFSEGAVAAVVELLGDERNRVVGLLRTLEGALGAEATVDAKAVATYGGEQGETAPWAICDVIEKGKVEESMAFLPRVMPYSGTAADRKSAAFRLVGILHGRYSNQLSPSGGRSWGRKLAPEKLGRAIELLADADLSLRGTKDWPPELVIEVLVARLTTLSKRR